ncbi:PREDICTED: microtubule-actin cross-linking factor 1-like isoform X2 [Priapulus caudatus]|uniref:Microtubule-actin cross-linking factor 1-like isoform X2 n=1 Tax=Priapulus caudatus TaxID=37621 RepID=A0ABM1F659_PRICU|nr:PREDICTED: microtubule-actin cross-linking factor 1-like isoform X2 [Priapulus caudatus]
MERAMQFHETLQNLMEWLDSSEERLDDMGALGADTEAIKQQINELKVFRDVDPRTVDVEALNQLAHDMMERASPESAQAIRAPLDEVNRRWNSYRERS